MSDINLAVKIAGVNWKNPVTTASGTFSIKDSSRCYDPSLLGALTTKGVASVPWLGNASPRIAETYGGMLNAVGLQNPGVETFLRDELPLLKQTGCPVIVNIAGKTQEEYAEVASRLSETDVDMLELNISCPNVKEGGVAFGTDANAVEAITSYVRKATEKPLIVKLSPNVARITDMAKAAESAGADALSLINTLIGMKIDVRTRRPVLANRMGGFSGPAVKPVAVRMVYEVRRAVQIPIIGMGGIMTGEDAAEFFLAGADAIAVGTAALIDPTAPVRILDELRAYLCEQGFTDINALKNALVL